MASTAVPIKQNLPQSFVCSGPGLQCAQILRQGPCQVLGPKGVGFKGFFAKSGENRILVDPFQQTFQGKIHFPMVLNRFQHQRLQVLLSAIPKQGRAPGQIVQMGDFPCGSFWCAVRNNFTGRRKSIFGLMAGCAGHFLVPGQKRGEEQGFSQCHTCRSGRVLTGSRNPGKGIWRRI